VPGLDDFAELIRRRLGATEVRPARGEAHGPSNDGPLVLTATLPGGDPIEVVFDDPKEPAEHLQQELELLLAAFRETLEPSSMPPDATPEHKWAQLRQLLAGLSARAGAIEVVVIDAHSPVVWGTAHADALAVERHFEPIDNVVWLHAPPDQRGSVAAERYARAAELGVRVMEAVVFDPRVRALVPDGVCRDHAVVPMFAAEDGLLIALADATDIDAAAAVARATGMSVEPVIVPPALLRLALAWKSRRPAEPAAFEPPSAERERLAEDTKRALLGRFAARRALRVVRALPEIPTLRKGGHVHRTVHEASQSVVVRSFGGIYVLVVILPERFDEIRAKHAVLQALPAIESLVAALPPRTPRDPIGAAGAMRRRR
jgi:hypothetical protein